MKVRTLLLALGVLGSAFAARGQIAFTINATPTSDSLGYVTTQSYNFVFTLNSAPDAGTAGTAGAGDYYDWYDEFTFHPPVWSNVAGDGLGAAWVQPVGDIADNASHLIATDSASTYVSPAISAGGAGSFQLYAGADQTDIGLTAQGEAVQFIYFAGNFTGLNFTNITGTLGDPNVYFADYLNSYLTSQSFTGWIRTTNFDNAFFTINSVSIAATSAVPEPATYGAMAGALALLGAGVWRRRARLA